jgi:GT2 family glycosyltransferase
LENSVITVSDLLITYPLPVQVRDAVENKEFEFALMLIANSCEQNPESSSRLFAFRQIYSEFLSADCRERLVEFHDAVSAPIPSVEFDKKPFGLVGLDDRVDLIIPVHNGLDHLKPCLESVFANSSNRLGNVIIVDDASGAETKEFVHSFCADVPEATLICTDESVGFTQAISLGVAESSSPFFVALNSDTIVLESWLEKLLATLDSAPNVAIVGPVSNSAAWQNIFEPVDEDGNFVRHPMPDYKGCCDLQETATKAAYLGPPVSPLVHGFCALLHRAAYDHVGQLDVVSFPRGYGEFQDLCLRFWDAGYRGKISNDCFVAHVGGASLESVRRSDLSKLARRTLYEKHTALRYLTFEAASIFSIPMAIWRAEFKLTYPSIFGRISV